MGVFARTRLRSGRRPWQDLPPELLGLVLQRIHSHAGRIRLRAVCRPWRAGARKQPPLPPLLPLLLQRDGTLLSLPDSSVQRIAIPDDVSCLMSTGSMLFLVHGDGRCSLFNPFSGDMEPQYVDADCFCLSRDPIVYNVRKVVIMSDHIITIQKIHKQYNSHHLSIRGRRPRGRRNRTTRVGIRWTPPVMASSVDAALFQDKLYILVPTHVGTMDLYVLDRITNDQACLQGILSTPMDDSLFPRFGHAVHSYLVPSGDRLLMVKQEIVRFNTKLVSAQFDVFEALDLSNGHARWRKVDTLIGRALFLSAGCAESLPASDRYAGAQEDCIYFLSELGAQDLRQVCISSGVYNIREGTLSPLPSEMVVAQDGPGTASWIFPTNT